MAEDMEPEELDIISRLPPEVVLNVTRSLTLRDVLNCCQVCSYWHDLFTSAEMAPFWRRINRAAGFGDNYFRYKGIPDHRLLHEIDKHRRMVSALKPEMIKFTGRHPFESATKCEYAGKGFFVKTIDYSSLESVETVIGELCPEERTIKKLDVMVGDHGPVTFATVIGDNIVWQTSDRYWFKYDINTSTFHTMFTTDGSQKMGDTIGYCRHCMFIVLGGTENCMHGFSWHFTFLKVDNGRDCRNPHKQLIKFPIPHGITQFIPSPVTAHLIPEDEHCTSHRMIVQGGTGGCVFKVTHELTSSSEDGIKLSPKPIGTMNPFYDSDIAVMVVKTTSRMTLSHDQKLIGMVTSVVYPYNSGLCLHIFDVDSYERLVSVKVDWMEKYNDTEVLCLSRLYAVLGVGHSKGILKVVNSQDGTVLLTLSKLSRGLPPVIPLARLLYVHYEGVYSEEALVDISSPFTLVVLYRKGVYRRGVGNIEALYFHPFPKRNKSNTAILLEEESEDDDRDDDD